jgi:hypothetical protein
MNVMLKDFTKNTFSKKAFAFVDKIPSKMRI